MIRNESVNLEKRRTNHRVLMWLLLFIGYEWFVSGINKLLSSEYIDRFRGTILDAINQSSPHFEYGIFLKFVVVPHSEIFAFLVMAGEIFAGAVFLILGIVGLIKGSLKFLAVKIGFVASVVSAILGINIFLFAGGPYFFLQGDPFDGGVTVDLLLFLFSLPLLGYFYTINRITKKVKA